MADFTADTIAVLQPLIKKPTLKAALLQKPPFRFLHDIVTNLQSSPSSFPPPSLFPAALLNSELVKEKEPKLAFLQRLISIVSAVNGSPVDVNAGKIIAGLEPEKTNDLLRALAKAAQSGLTEAEITERVDGSPAPPKEEAKPAPAPAAAPPPTKKAEAAAAAPPAASKGAPRPSPPLKAAAAPLADANAAPSQSSSAAPIALPPAPSGAEDFTATTQRLLGALITKPTLKANLLQKPPFRFLHDIVNSLIASPCHYPADYFTQEESNSALIDSSEKKVAFLRRLIEVVEATGPFDLSSVNPKKIVAGLEADNTNLLLQSLAKAAASGVTAVEAMARKSAGTGKAAVAAKEVAKTVKGSVEEKSTPAVQAPVKGAKAGPVKATPAVAAPAAVPKLALQSMESETTSLPPAPTADSDGSQRVMERPMTARQGPPKVKPPPAVVETKEQKETSPADKAEGNGGKAADKKRGVIVEGEAVEEEEDIAEEDPQPVDNTESLKAFEGEEKVNVLEQGNLMRKIIQATDTGEKQVVPGVVVPGVGEAGVKGEDRAIGLKTQIQKLCHSIGPLGKCFEFIVDDMDEMGREMGKWKQQRDEYAQGVEEARRQTARVVEPLEGQLEEAEKKVVEWEKRIMALQCTLYAQEQSIFRLLEQKVALDQ